MQTSIVDTNEDYVVIRSDWEDRIVAMIHDEIRMSNQQMDTRFDQMNTRFDRLSEWCAFPDIKKAASCVLLFLSDKQQRKSACTHHHSSDVADNDLNMRIDNLIRCTDFHMDKDTLVSCIDKARNHYHCRSDDPTTIEELDQCVALGLSALDLCKDSPNIHKFKFEEMILQNYDEIKLLFPDNKSNK